MFVNKLHFLRQLKMYIVFKKSVISLDVFLFKLHMDADVPECRYRARFSHVVQCIWYFQIMSIQNTDSDKCELYDYTQSVSLLVSLGPEKDALTKKKL